MDALSIAEDDSEEEVLAYESKRDSRRLEARRAATPAEDPVEKIVRWLGGATRPRKPADATRFQKTAQSRRRRLQTYGTQYQQEEELAVSLMVYKARENGQTVFTDEGLEEMCTLHQTITSAVDYDDYCRLQLSWTTENGTRNTYCAVGLTPLGFFYGDADYDIDSLDLSVLQMSNLNDVLATYVADGANATRAQYGDADADAAINLYDKIEEYWTNPWTNGTLVHSANASCAATLKKNTTAVVTLVAAIRATPTLDDRFGGLINYFFDDGFNNSTLVSEYTRGLFDFGGPLEGFSDVINSDDESEQESQFADWWFDQDLDKAVDENKRSLWRVTQPTCLNTALLFQILIRLLVVDGAMAIVPLFIVFIVVWLQTRSLFIAIITLTEMLLAFTAAIFCSAGILQIKWVAFEQFLALYIVLAIGADDVFVFMDAYYQSFYMGPKVNASFETRMAWVYRRAGLAMLITSLTTAAAFVATAASSPIPTLQNFGIFAAWVILIDYVLVMTLLCSCVVIYHNCFEMKTGLCCGCCAPCAVGEPGSTCDAALCYPKQRGGCNRMCVGNGDGKYKTSTEIAREGGEATAQGKKSALTTFFEDSFPFNLVVKNPVTRGLSIFVFLAILPAAIYGVSQLQAQTSAEQFLPESHPFQRFFTAQTKFRSSNEDDTVEINIVWGFVADDPIDLDGVNRLFKPNEKGTPNYDPAFALDEAAQEAIAETCVKLRASDAVKVEYDSDTGEQIDTVYCWIDRFRLWREAQGLSFPVPADEAEAEVLSWLENNFDYSNGAEYPEAARPYDDDDNEDFGWVREGDGLKLLWTRVRAASTMNENAYLPASELRDEYDEWEAIVADINEDSPPSLGKAMQVCDGASAEEGNKWLSMILQETYVRMALVGVVIGLTLSFVVLLLATMNVIMAVLCVGTIAAALACVAGCIVMMGWELGQAESLAMMILTGFAVDYVVHLAHAYMESSSASRLERTHDALRDLGVSVFWGALTSVVASAVLANLQLQFFSKFGTFFLLTIVWAYLWAVLFLMPLLAFVGPEVKGGKEGGTPPTYGAAL